MGITTIEEGNFIEVNEAFCKTFDFSEKEIIGKTIYDLDIYNNIEDKDKFHNSINKNIKIYDEEFLFKTKTGKKIVLLISVDIVTMKGKQYLLVMSNNITEKKLAEEEVIRTNKKLIETAHLAGKAEIASNVLHDIGNILNSVYVSSSLIKDTIIKSRIEKLSSLSKLFKDNINNLNNFIVSEQGKNILDYLFTLSDELMNEKGFLIQKTDKLIEHIEYIKEVLRLQYSVSRAGGLIELLSIDDIIHEAIEMNKESFKRYNIIVNIKSSGLKPFYLDRHRIMQILLNLLNNAKSALHKNINNKKKVINIQIDKIIDNRIIIKVFDNGVGISGKNMIKIFKHGFTTKKEGHGFGLHSAFNAATEMGGALSCHSDGIEKGATFFLELNYDTKNK